MAELRHTRGLFLTFMSIIYLFAFTSLYVQIPGLFGNNGILPARTQLDIKPGPFNDDYLKQIQKKPTLLWFAPYLGVDTEYMMDILALTGIFLSFTGFVSEKFCNKPIFAALWSLYFSLYQVGQTFMWFQWDVLLLEAGFLSILLAPWYHKSHRGSKKQPPPSAPSEHIRFWLVKWLLFRLMFSSGVVKLSSGCPTWWGLTALSVHFESMCIPTPLAWYAHYLPSWFLKLNTVLANFAEIFVPPLFFFPVRYVRIFAFWIQVFLQSAIILTGNYNFFNYLTLTLCLSLLDDDFFIESNKKTSFTSKVTSLLATLAVYGALIYATIVYYSIKVLPGGIIESKIKFTPADFDEALKRFLPFLVFWGFFSFLVTSIKSFVLVFSQPGSKLGRISNLLSTIFYIFVALFIFTDSTVPFSSLHPAGNFSFVPAETHEMHNRLAHLHLTNPYGLFRRMTGVGGRPEIIIEGSNKMEGPWLEYHFRYKPGDVNQSLPFVAPHQPRLDWQMWFAALGTYHQNPWITSLAYRLLTGQQEVLNLLDTTKNPFPNQPPKYIRGSLYHYHYTSWAHRDKQTTWTRQKVSEYFPIFSKDHQPLLDYLKNMKILETKQEKKSPTVINVLNEIRNKFGTIEPTYLLMSILLTGLAIILFGSLQSTPTPTKPQIQQIQQTSRKQKKNK